MDSEKEKLIIRELTVGVVGTCCYIVFYMIMRKKINLVII